MGNKEPQIFQLGSDMIRSLFVKDPSAGALEVERDDKVWDRGLAQMIRKTFLDVVATIKCTLKLSYNYF